MTTQYARWLHPLVEWVLFAALFAFIAWCVLRGAR